MLKGILKYSIVAILVIMAGLYPSLATFNKYAILLLIIPIAILAIGSVRFYRKRNTDNKRLLKSIIFFIASLLLTSGVIFALSVLFFMTLWGPDGSTILVFFPLVLGTMITYGISINKGSKHTLRNTVIASVFIYNFTIIYFLSVSTIESWFGIDYNLFYDDPTIKVTTPYGEFSAIDNSYEKYYNRNNKRRYDIDSIATYDHYLVMATDSSYLLINKQANDTTVTQVSSLTELPINVQHKDFVRASEYIKNLYWQIHNDNYLFVIKILIALVLSALVTAIEYFVLKKIWARMREFVS